MNEEDQEDKQHDNTNSKKSFFRSIFTRKKSGNHNNRMTLSNPSINSCASSCFESSEELYPSFSYEEIISGNVRLNQLNLEKIEVIIVFTSFSI